MLLTKSVIYRGKETPYEQLKHHSMIPLTVQCDICGTIFETTKYQLVRNGHELCQACALRSNLEKTIPAGSIFGKLTVLGPGSRGGTSLCECSCEKHTIVEIENYNLITGKTQSCGCLRSENGKRIAAEYLSKYQKGENHPQWKGGVSPERNRIEKTIEYKKFKADVFERDNYKCQACGGTENLVVHHLYNFQDNPNKRIDVDNGVCMCESCHRKFHNIFGNKNTTTEQFEAFLYL